MLISSIAGNPGAWLARSAERLSRDERAALYQQVFGAPGGSADGPAPNREFNDLWLRFVSGIAVARARQAAPLPWMSATAERVQAGARELAARVGAEIGRAAGSRDQWNVIDSVATFHLGGAAQSARHRALADAGGAILESLLVAGPGAGQGDRPFDASSELADHVEHWLAVGLTRDAEVDALSQPGAARRRIDDWALQLHTALGVTPDRFGARIAAVFGNAASASDAGAASAASAPAGTGKTLAAHWLAAERGVDVHRIDLSRVVSKYIGETEKNLATVFGDAERTGALLLFDDADALFGKRTDVRDSHDRYANAETGYLLERIERHDGVVVIATDASDSADAGFDPDVLKRLRYVAFPLPVPPRQA